MNQSTTRKKTRYAERKKDLITTRDPREVGLDGLLAGVAMADVDGGSAQTVWQA
jgi:hypothetical protein